MRRRVATLAAATMFALAFSVTPVMASSPADPEHGGGHDLTCAGGSIAGGTYGFVTVTGICTVDAGSITVRHDLVVKNGGALVAVSGGSNVTVRGDLRVQKNGVLALGCGQPSSVCLNDPAYGDMTGTIIPTLSAAGRVGHDLTADKALAVVVHNTRVTHNVSQRGGGGGISCDIDPNNPFEVALGSPAYSTYEDTTVGGSVRITGLRTCWLGFLHNTVGGEVTFNNNAAPFQYTDTTVDPPVTYPADGNEIAANTIRGDLHCAKNNPAPQLGDSTLPLNVVGGRATGQCAGLTKP